MKGLYEHIKASFFFGAKNIEIVYNYTYLLYLCFLDDKKYEVTTSISDFKKGNYNILIIFDKVDFSSEVEALDIINLKELKNEYKEELKEIDNRINQIISKIDLSKMDYGVLEQMLDSSNTIKNILKVGEELYVRNYGLYKGKRYNLKWIYDYIVEHYKDVEDENKKEILNYWVERYKEATKRIIENGDKFYGLRFLVEKLYEEYKSKNKEPLYYKDMKNENDIIVTENNEIPF